jgi:hypothetical protein
VASGSFDTGRRWEISVESSVFMHIGHGRTMIDLDCTHLLLGLRQRVVGAHEGRDRRAIDRSKQGDVPRNTNLEVWYEHYSFFV